MCSVASCDSRLEAIFTLLSPKRQCMVLNRSLHFKFPFHFQKPRINTCSMRTLVWKEKEKKSHAERNDAISKETRRASSRHIVDALWEPNTKWISSCSEWGLRKVKCSALTAKFPVGKRYEHGCTSWQCIWSMLRDVDYMACCWFLIQICLRRSYTVHSRRQFQSRQWLRLWMFIERRRFQQRRSPRKQTYCAQRPQRGISIPWIWSSL